MHDWCELSVALFRLQQRGTYAFATEAAIEGALRSKSVPVRGVWRGGWFERIEEKISDAATISVRTNWIRMAPFKEYLRVEVAFKKLESWLLENAVLVGSAFEAGAKQTVKAENACAEWLRHQREVPIQTKAEVWAKLQSELGPSLGITAFRRA